MKLYLLIGMMVSGTLLAGAAAVGMGLASDRYSRDHVATFGYQGLVVFWLGVVLSAWYLHQNRDR